MQTTLSGPIYSISYRFSKTANPGMQDWCYYAEWFGATPISYFNLGDSASFLLIAFGDGTSAPSLLAIGKPPVGTVCPTANSFKKRVFNNLINAPATLIPANQIDNLSDGYVMAYSGAQAITILPVVADADGMPAVGAARMLALPAFNAPPLAAQQPKLTTATIPTRPLRIDTTPSQLIQAFDPRLNKYAMWFAHTVADRTNPNASRVRWYEIDPVPATPVLLRSGEVGVRGTYVFNPAISPDRRVLGPISQFGGSFVIAATQSSETIAPGLVAFSSVNGRAVRSAPIAQGVAPFRGTYCPRGEPWCYWGGASAQPDPGAAGVTPAPYPGESGVVWVSGQYGGIQAPSLSKANYTTWNAAISP